ncbi:MAG: Crp/Fnr family transcriptional regulator [Roseivirga sp.]
MTASDIFKDLDLSEALNQEIDEKLVLLSVQKGDVLLSPGDYAHYQYFVVEGCLRSYTIGSEAKEHTVQFAIADWWVSDYTAFYKQEKAILYVECLRDATLFRLSGEDMLALFKKSQSIETFFRQKTESYISSFQKRIIGDLAKTAKERYSDFVRTYPNIEKLVKNYHIASYLGITSESLSRVRKELAHS